MASDVDLGASGGRSRGTASITTAHRTGADGAAPPRGGRSSQFAEKILQAEAQLRRTSSYVAVVTQFLEGRCSQFVFAELFEEDKITFVVTSYDARDIKRHRWKAAAAQRLLQRQHVAAERLRALERERDGLLAGDAVDSVLISTVEGAPKDLVARAGEAASQLPAEPRAVPQQEQQEADEWPRACERECGELLAGEIIENTISSTVISALKACGARTREASSEAPTPLLGHVGPSGHYFWRALDTRSRQWLKRRLGSYKADKLAEKMVHFALVNTQQQLERTGYGYFSMDTLKGATDHLLLNTED